MIEVKSLYKSFEDKEVLKDINSVFENGKTNLIIGQSGSGKTVLMKCIVGLFRPTSGEVLYDGRDLVTMNKQEWKMLRREMGMIFQSAALFDSMTVLENVMFPLDMFSKDSYAERVKRAQFCLDRVNLLEAQKKFPDEISGGMQKRVAIARALANNPRVLLLDEPLGALDLQLRRTMQLELKRLQKKLGITFIYITHDQEEAINMSDRIVVMNQGQFEQIGTPDEIYNHPKTSYVATFVGNANILKGKVAEINGSYAQVEIGNDTVSVYTEETVKVGEQLTLAVRSENILLDEAEMENVVEQNEAEGTGRHLHATVKEKNFAAGQLRVLLALSDGTEITASRFGMNANIQSGQQIKWYFDPRNAVVVDREIKTKEPADMSGGNQ